MRARGRVWLTSVSPCCFPAEHGRDKDSNLLNVNSGVTIVITVILLRLLRLFIPYYVYDCYGSVMVKRTCSQCGENTGKRRANAKYCSDACKQQAYYQRHGRIVTTSAQPKASLGSLVSSTPPDAPRDERAERSETTFLTTNPKYSELESELVRLYKERDWWVGERTKIVEEITKLSGGGKLARNGALLGLAIGGTLGAAAAAKKKKPTFSDYLEMILFGAAAAGAVAGVAGFAIQESGMIEPTVKPEHIGLIELKKRAITSIDNRLLAVDVSIQSVYEAMDNTPRRVRKQIQAPEKQETPAKQAQIIKAPEILAPVLSQLKSAPERQEAVIINSSEFIEKRFQTWKFTDRLAALFGQPEFGAIAIVHGPPGAGKSTLCASLAGELSKKHGKVLYVCAEEGLKKTMQDKIQAHHSQQLDLAECFTYDVLDYTLRTNPYPFVIIDSLQVLDITPGQLEAFRKIHPARLYICISQTNKAGTMRGSQEFAHNADIVVKVENHSARSEKNRYGPTGESVGVLSYA